MTVYTYVCDQWIAESVCIQKMTSFVSLCDSDGRSGQLPEGV